MRRLLLLLLVMNLSPLKADELLIPDGQGNEIGVQVAPAEGDLLIIWLVDHAEERPMFDDLLQAVNRRGVEIWRVDLLSSYFLPRSSETIRTLPGDAVAALLSAAHQAGRKRILLAAYDRMPLPLLRGVHQWQQGQSDSRLAGALLFYPNLFEPPAVAGEAPTLDPILDASNIPLVIFQPALGNQRWRLGQVMSALWQTGSPAYAYLVPEVRDWFFMGESDHGSGDKAVTAALPDQILAFAKLLDSYAKQTTALPLRRAEQPRRIVSRLVELKPARMAPGFNLKDLQGHSLASTSLADQVVLVNFWATWCPPCVEEVPSLNRLQQHYVGKDVRIVSIDFREGADELAAFTQRIPVEFPVLLDKQGRTALDWQVFSFPSTFILDRQGRLRHSANRAIDWDSPEVWQVLDRLLQEE
jgi:thiol-disulfide isomerase/thioredoxin